MDLRLVGRPAVGHAGDHRAGGVLQAQALGDVRRHLLDAHAQPAAPRMAVFLQLRDDVLRHVRRDREADADRPAGRRVDRRVDADHLAVHVEQRAARVAAVDRRVGLDEVVVRPLMDVAAARRDDAGGHGAAQAERIADRQHPVADARLRRNRRTPPSAAACPASPSAARCRRSRRGRPPWPSAWCCPAASR